MKPLSKATTNLVSFLSLLISVSNVEAHGYLKSPRSRNFVAYQDGVWWGGSSDGVYRKENCPHCANVGGICGKIGRRNYNLPKSLKRTLMPPDPQAVYQQGDIITIEVVLTAHHMGHFEFKACPIQNTGDEPTQACFDRYPLEYVSDNLYDAPKDDKYYTRAYIPPSSISERDRSPGIVPGHKFSYEFQLPSTLSGELVLLQWHYITGNTCKVPGYDEYNFPPEWGSLGGNVGRCNLPIPSDGGGAPEQFWNCAEIKILSKDGDQATPPMEPPIAQAPQRAPIVSQTPPPITTPTVTPINPPTPFPRRATRKPTRATSDTNTFCGKGRVGNGICENSNQCCSKFGWCGNSRAHCRNSATSDSCGYGIVGNGICNNPLLCCSIHGWCGKTRAHCNS